MFTKEECGLFFSKTLGLDLDEKELDDIWNELFKNPITPINRHGKNNIGFTPLRLKRIIELALKRTGVSLENKRFKKVSEEIFPAIYFSLFLRHEGMGKFLIISRDAPDIALIDFENGSDGPVSVRRSAVPLELTFFPEDAIRNAPGDSTEEKIASLITIKKFNMRYAPETILLVTINAVLKNVSFEIICKYLSAKGNNPFHQIWLLVTLESDDCAFIMLSPSFQFKKLSVANDLLTLMY